MTVDSANLGTWTGAGWTQVGGGTSPVAPAAPVAQPTPTSIPFKSGLSSAQQQSIQQLSQKPIASWTATDRTNWNYATNGAPPPAGSSPVAPTIQAAPAPTPAASPSPSPSPKDVPPGFETWPDSAKETYALNEQKVNDLASAGKVVNPNITIDQATIDRFVSQARAELEPYYKQTFAQLDTDLKTAVQKQKDEYGNAIRDIGLTYGKGLETTQQNYANRGLEFSSDRAKSEQEIKDEAARKVEEAAKATQQNVQSIGTDAERKLGSSLMPNLGTLETGYSMQSGPGQYGLGSAMGSRSLFSATPGTTGTLERQRLFEEESRKNELISNERDLRGILTQ